MQWNEKQKKKNLQAKFNRKSARNENKNWEKEKVNKKKTQTPSTSSI